MEVINFAQQQSLINHYLVQLRDVSQQKNRMRFRENIKRISYCMAHEISKNLDFQEKEVTTPLANAKGKVLSESPVLALVLRAGLAMHQGFVEAFDESDHCFISAYREEGDKHNIKVHVDYLASPDLSNRTVIMIDPMLATGTSMVLGYKALLRNGTPKKIYGAGIVAAPEGVEFIKEHIPEMEKFWTASIDEGLNDRAYIVPGLGDAGDLAYGEKISQ
jgi:uracil phosphoribosyltransferase